MASVHSLSQGNPRIIDALMTDDLTLGAQTDIICAFLILESDVNCPVTLIPVGTGNKSANIWMPSIQKALFQQ